jgi:hypothetical protein
MAKKSNAGRPTVMTPEEFTQKMMSVFIGDGWNDPEIAHSEMDELLCEVLVGLGYHEGVDIFRKQDKWYA